MIDPAFRAVLRILHERFGSSTITWAVTGSVGLALHGVPVTPHDIDIQTDAAGAYEIERRCREYVTRPVVFSAAERVASHFGALLVDGIKVEIMGDMQHRASDGSWEPPPDLVRIIHVVRLEDLDLPVLPLEHECAAYRKLGRPERAEFLQRWLQNHASARD